jgi:hypothetical protein
MDCAAEWTVAEEVPDLAGVVTADEIIEVHEQLNSGKTLEEFIPKEKT